jgi:hypothetical protein
MAGYGANRRGGRDDWRSGVDMTLEIRNVFQVPDLRRRKCLSKARSTGRQEYVTHAVPFRFVIGGQRRRNGQFAIIKAMRISLVSFAQIFVSFTAYSRRTVAAVAWRLAE